MAGVFRTIKEGTEPTVTWLKNHWFLFAALVAIGIAWGTVVAKVDGMNNEINQLKSDKEYVQELGRSAERLDERTLILQQSMQRQEALLIELLRGQRRIESSQGVR